MIGRDYDRSVTLLVWALIAIGLVAGAITNGLVGWTLLDLNRERLRLLEQDRRLNQDAARLHRLSQEIRGGIVTLLQGGEEAGELPHSEFVQVLQALGEDFSGTLHRDLQAAAAHMTGLRRQAQDWRERYRVVADDLQQKRTLGQARELLEALRGGAESLEGQLRLEEAILLRRWRLAQGAEATPLAAQLLEKQTHGRVRMLKEVRTEIADLARLVETLAGEDQLDYLADLRDNQLKPVLERLERQVGILALELDLPEGLTPQAVAGLRDILFGRGHAIVAEYQTIRLGEGGLFRLSSDALALRREREGLQEEAQALSATMEAIHPTLTALTGERSRALAHHAERSLSAGLQKLLLVNLLFLVGFLALGWLISRRVRHQILTLAQLRRHNELILNSAGEGILGLDRQGRTTFINPAGARLLGGEPAAMLGRHHRELLRHHSDDWPSLETSSVATVLAIGTALHLTDELFQRADGGSFPGECTATPIRNEKGEIEGAVITLLDITLRKDAEIALQRSFAELERRKEELDELNRRLEEKVEERTRLLENKSLQLIQAQEELLRAEKLAAIGSLAAGVAHEINNPAAIIRGNVEILRRKLPADDPRREEAQEILKQTERISRITQELLTFARKQTITPEQVEINPLLEEILAQATHQVPLGRIEMRCDLDLTLPPLTADRERLRQVFTNLLINALQAMDGEGTLTVTSRSLRDAIEVTVADTGPGLPLELRGKIFNPFFTTKPTGTGLGLSVSYGIIQALGGTIEVGGEAGRGAVFTILLPVENTLSMGRR